MAKVTHVNKQQMKDLTGKGRNVQEGVFGDIAGGFKSQLGMKGHQLSDPDSAYIAGGKSGAGNIGHAAALPVQGARAALRGIGRAAKAVGQAVAAPVTAPLAAKSRHQELQKQSQAVANPDATVPQTQKPANFVDKFGRKIGQGIYAAQQRGNLSMAKGKGRVGAFVQGFQQPVEHVTKSGHVIQSSITRSGASPKYGL